MKDEKTFEEKHVPTIEQTEDFYRSYLRNKINSDIPFEKLEILEKQGEFFNKFRKTYDIGEVENEQVDNLYYKKYIEYIENELKNQKTKIEVLEALIAYEKFFLNWERKLNKEINNDSHYGSSSATRYRIDSINSLEKQLERLIKESPEAWEFYYKRKLLEDINRQNQKELVEVAYVKNAKDKIIESLNLGRPVYLVGHLGSGKTQLALEAARDFTLENKIQKSIEKHMEAWFKDNLDAKESEVIEAFIKILGKEKAYYKNIALGGDKEEIESLEALFISGSHNLTYEDMFVEKTLSLEQSFSHGSFVEYLDNIIKDFYEWMQEHEEELMEMTEEEQLQLKIQIWKSFSDLLVASNSAFGTVVNKVEKEILMAMKQGRVVIIDELNAIAMQNLIALNDVLQRHAGTTAYITGVGPVYIEHGFGLIGTGNLSTQMVNYEGTNELNPAFKSRFVTIEYNYVNQEIIGAMSEQEEPEKNELFRIILSRLADVNGSIKLPNPEKSLDELFRFAQLSRLTQNIFMGKWEDDDGEKNYNTGEVELRESVLSIRNILNVLDSWNLGEEKDLSMALWDGFISSITYPDDQNYILAQAVRFGFFLESEGWKIRVKGTGELATSYEDIRTRTYEYTRARIENISYLDIIEILHGKKPVRKSYPKDLEEIFKIENSMSIDLKKYENLNEKLTHLEHSKYLLEYLEGGEF